MEQLVPLSSAMAAETMAPGAEQPPKFGGLYTVNTFILEFNR
jgi:hypothetical protein